MAKNNSDYRSDCIFCQIAAGKLPTSIRFQDAEMLAFDDINPHAPIHILVISKKHIDSLTEVTKSDELLLGRMLYRCKLLAEEMNIADSGYRVTINVGKWGGQIVPHLHLHLLGGAPLTERLSIYTETQTIATAQ